MWASSMLTRIKLFPCSLTSWSHKKYALTSTCLRDSISWHTTHKIPTFCPHPAMAALDLCLPEPSEGFQELTRLPRSAVSPHLSWVHRQGGAHKPGKCGSFPLQHWALRTDLSESPVTLAPSCPVSRSLTMHSCFCFSEDVKKTTHDRKATLSPALHLSYKDDQKNKMASLN